MTQEVRWLTRCHEVIAFIECNHRNPIPEQARLPVAFQTIGIEEHDMLNWLKANRKRMNAGEMKEPRLSRFKELLALIEEHKRKNQYE